MLAAQHCHIEVLMWYGYGRNFTSGWKWTHVHFQPITMAYVIHSNLWFSPATSFPPMRHHHHACTHGAHVRPDGCSTGRLIIEHEVLHTSHPPVGPCTYKVYVLYDLVHHIISGVYTIIYPIITHACLCTYVCIDRKIMKRDQIRFPPKKEKKKDPIIGSIWIHTIPGYKVLHNFL